MRNLFTLLIFSTLSFITINTSAQNLTGLLKSGDYETLATHFDHEVNIEFKRDRETLSRTQAIKKIKNKMRAFRPVKWEDMHKGKADNTEDNYFIVKVYNAKNEGLRIFIHVEEIGGVKKVCSVRFRSLLR